MPSLLGLGEPRLLSMLRAWTFHASPLLMVSSDGAEETLKILNTSVCNTSEAMLSVASLSGPCIGHSASIAT